MNRTPARIVSIALVAAAPVFAAGTTQGDSSTRHESSASSSAHQLAADFKGAMHKLADATRHALHRADAALHRGAGKRDKDA
jgi:hypothetical protein